MQFNEDARSYFFKCLDNIRLFDTMETFKILINMCH